MYSSYPSWIYIFLLLQLNLHIPPTLAEFTYSSYPSWIYIFLLPQLNLHIPSTLVEFTYSSYPGWIFIFLLPRLNLSIPPTPVEFTYSSYPNWIYVFLLLQLNSWYLGYQSQSVCLHLKKMNSINLIFSLNIICWVLKWIIIEYLKL